ncbi:MAG: allantoicase [Deltaproteobacteria bacterium]|nr:allantoicase [Deltaproteobacteria bacterium]MBU53298.1 allantoicase [Deltaproteobacteria bacterium]|tara:strand:+ start:6217 stop:7245 length:1029 start_codon:yes stop_codon:yes gene_type:complete
MKDNQSIGISNGIDLLAESLGGKALLCSDDFFASMDNLVKEGRGVFLPDEYTERGKWMDGWESRRKRDEGHDWCILKLGVPGVISVFDIDTNHFLGNHAPFASVEGCFAPDADDTSDFSDVNWKPLLGQVPLQRGSQNLCMASSQEPVTHLKLHIYPDGGVARFRAYGKPMPRWEQSEDDSRFPLKEGEIDLAALRNGGEALVCSDMFFGTMHNLIAPGRARVMGEGWETRRSRREGYDWIIVKLGAIGNIDFVVADTNHFKGNFPESFRLYGLHAPETSLLELQQSSQPWEEIIPQTKMQAHHEHMFRDEIKARGPFSHVRLDIFPDGGVSRLRVYGSKAS